MNDRGSIKWTAMMMPEHIQLLNDMWKRKEYKEKPVLDEQQLEEINRKLHMAIHKHLSAEITYYADYDYRKITGKLFKIETSEGFIKVDNEHRTKIYLNNILDIKID
ncbi:YolD-like family protein [Oceanobacillus damuensis]|uniref:YolD-like family protein n=1 Tax=Oceanobacillus damuensis TaxID=937928 RepID=UPI000834D532|nr:YolD-like family protein [Oceanobacillus damuensis]